MLFITGNTMTKRKKTIFFPPKHKRLAKKIRIDTPANFRKSISDLKKDGLTTTEKRALVLARNRAKAQLNRKDLSREERKEMRIISKMPI